jgi:hypothetical protein
MSDLDIKKAVILAKQPEAKAKLDTANEVYVEARFDTICEGLAGVSGADKLGEVIAGSRKEVKTDEGEVDLEKKRQDAITREDARSAKPLGAKK